jgi:hypothetical protein
MKEIFVLGSLSAQLDSTGGKYQLLVECLTKVSNAPASDLDTLGDYLIKNPALLKLADVALILQGNGDGGLAYVGTGTFFCQTQN